MSEGIVKRGPFVCTRCGNDMIGFALSFAYEDGRRECAHFTMEDGDKHVAKQFHPEWSEEQVASHCKTLNEHRRKTFPLPHKQHKYWSQYR